MATVSSISASEANRSFSKLLRRAQLGEAITITSHGRPVAVLKPADDKGEVEREQIKQALADLQAHWKTLKPVTIGPYERENLYDRNQR